MIKAPDVTLLYVLLAFTVSYAILKRFLFRPLSAILEERQALEESAALVHRKSLEEMERAVAEAEAALAAARREALRLREELRAQGTAHLEREMSRAREETTESIRSATGEIGEEARRTAAELPRRAVELARGLAEKVLGRRLAA
jgi:F-type H+-transporting ATPase subunit b